VVRVAIVGLQGIARALACRYHTSGAHGKAFPIGIECLVQMPCHYSRAVERSGRNIVFVFLVKRSTRSLLASYMHNHALISCPCKLNAAAVTCFQNADSCMGIFLVDLYERLRLLACLGHRWSLGASRMLGGRIVYFQGHSKVCL
jgi:hypothetical protein